jgi:pimeloyl-ACP methyl ester carboxylesterase
MPYLLKGEHNPSGLFRLMMPKRRLSLNALDAAYRMLRSLAANRPVLRRALVRMTPTLAHDDDFEILVDDAVGMSPDAAIGHLRSLETWNVQEELAKLRVPVLILWGDLDTLIGRDALERTIGDLHLGELVIWPDVGHAPQLEQPERFVALLSEFVDKNTVFTTGGIGRFLSRFWSRKAHGRQ